MEGRAMDEGEMKFWLSCAAIALATVVVMAGCSAHETRVKADAVESMVKSGAQPLDASCALGVSDVSRQVCAIVAARK